MVKTLVFIHGWASSPCVWREQEQYFSRSYGVALPDITAAENLGQAAEIVADSVKDENDCVIAGWSLGWLAALELLKRRGLKPSGLVSVNSTPKFVDDGYLGTGPTKTHLAKMMRDCKADLKRALEDFVASAFPDISRETLANFDLCFINRATDDSGSSTPDGCMNPGYGRLLHGLEMLRVSDYREYLEQVDIPTLLIAGAFDPICPKEASTYMHRRIPVSQLRVMDSGHAPFLARPHEFNAVVDNFIKGLR